MPPVKCPAIQPYLFYLTTAGTRMATFPLCRSIRGAKHIPAGPCIFAPNHLSFLDGPLVVNELNRVLRFPIHMMSIKEPFDHPFFGLIMRISGCIPYDRSDPTGGKTALAKQLAFLREGQKVALFPEGHLGNAQRIRRCRMGMALLAMESGAPVVPTALVGTDRVLPPGDKRFHLGKRATITLAPAIDPAPWRSSYATADITEKRAILLDFTREVMKMVGVLSGQQVTW